MVTLRAFKHSHMRCCSNTGLHGKKNQTSLLRPLLHISVWRVQMLVTCRSCCCTWMNSLHCCNSSLIRCISSSCSFLDISSSASRSWHATSDTGHTSRNIHHQDPLQKNSKEHLISKSLEFARTRTAFKNKNSLIHCDGMRVSKWYDWLFSDKCKWRFLVK